MTTGDMDRPSEGDRPGAVDDAIWTELVASFHASTADRPGLWPDVENLPADPDAPASAAGTGTTPGPSTTGTGTGAAPGSPSAASYSPGMDTTGSGPGTTAGPGTGMDTGAAAVPNASGGTLPSPPSRVVRPASRPGQDVPPPAAPPAVTWTAAGPRDWDTPAGPVDEDGFVPLPPPPLPELGMGTKAAWVAGLGGPGYLALATLLHWDTPQWAALLCVLSGVVGFAYLVSRLKDRPEDGEDDPDDYGAVL